MADMHLAQIVHTKQVLWNVLIINHEETSKVGLLAENFAQILVKAQSLIALAQCTSSLALFLNT